MISFRVDKDTGLAEYVCHSTKLHDRTVVNCFFSKELSATLKTLVAFCAYHHANDPNAVGPMDNYYVITLADYSGVTYDKLHNYPEEGLRAWYALFKAYDLSQRRMTSTMSTWRRALKVMVVYLWALWCPYPVCLQLSL
jgi:hypothetical protein